MNSELQSDGRNMDQTVTLQDLVPFSGIQMMLILVGLVASGKSTFAQALERHFPQFRRCNQDELGTRKDVEILARRTLREGLSPCIDRTNFDALQRSHWIKIAREFPGTSINVIVFDTPYQVCSSRLLQRSSHPTIKDPQQGQSILATFASDFQFPQPNEGYGHIIYLTPSDHPRPEYTREDISLILQRLQASSPDFKIANTQPPAQAFFASASSTPVLTRGSAHRGRYTHRGRRNNPYSSSRPQSYSRSDGRGGTSRAVNSEAHSTSQHKDSGGHGAVPGV
ncbi:hypothetical protein K503DRAFT_715723 [Rhizopogon vinicolor AM-OR11-026]|uniref:P-loop containing nucleoside triphosphate hydrolase protein n=1 Tax=Rhizopogon vinicolor AM-OR11-026 TaxID=1314800 RepID=A0A1B7N4P2_9AGAM|nr:hypothetical protein K503DRAFT_715723 [Rhizopogon vinicolor AM-OR11-026]